MAVVVGSTIGSGIFRSPAGIADRIPGPLPLLQLGVAAVFCTGLATVAWNVGVSRLGIQSGGLWQNTVPVFAVLISLLFFGVPPLAEQLVGGAVVLAGVLYMQWQRLRGTLTSRSPA